MSAEHVGTHACELEVVGIEVAQLSDDRLSLVHKRLCVEGVSLALVFELTLFHILEQSDTCDAGRCHDSGRRHDRRRGVVKSEKVTDDNLLITLRLYSPQPLWNMMESSEIAKPYQKGCSVSESNDVSECKGGTASTTVANNKIKNKKSDIYAGGLRDGMATEDSH